MNLVSIASHTVDIDLLPHSPLVLDVGCRGFDFTRAVMKHRPGAVIWCYDPSPDIQSTEAPDPSRFVSCAIVGTERNYALLADHSTGEGNFICDDVPWYAKGHAVQCISIGKLTKDVPFWDLVKLDCEGSEFGILENWPGPIATQLSVEFHDWTGPWCHHVEGDYYERLFAGPLKDYEVVQHELSKQGEGIGHWDSVFRLKK